MYQALYRKWRPRNFDEVAGQTHIVSLLKKEVAEGRISHAYLMCGIRGTGKTTIAKILAKAVNCENPHEGNPCDKCDSCRSINSGENIDITEIDAASNNGVDDVRTLRDETVYTPAMSKYKVYIIDEVHMLSTAAFNALLKTLEEPPVHVIFILATTELAKIPPTILSRCQRFDFKKIPTDIIEARLSQVCESEGIRIEKEALELIAKLSDGALRDALSILDQCASLSGEITYQKVAEITGVGSRAYLPGLAEAVYERDYEKVITKLHELSQSSKSPDSVITETIEYFRDMLLTKSLRDYKDMLITSPAELGELLNAAQRFSTSDLLFYIGILQRELDIMARSRNKKLNLELAFYKLCSPRDIATTEALSARLFELEKKIALIERGNVVLKTPPNAERDKADRGKLSEKIEDSEKKAEDKTHKDEAKETQNQKFDLNIWNEVLKKIQPSISASLKRARVKSEGEKLIIETQSLMTHKMLSENKSITDEIVSSLAALGGGNFKIEVRLIDEKKEKNQAEINRQRFLENLNKFKQED